jgi:hypothetical protein
VGRPRGAAWRSLQADGVVWEGQVLLVGGEVDLAARMIVTHRRVAFVRGGEIVLEIPRGWLRQEPVLHRDGVLDLFVATPESNPFDEPMRVPLRMREGHPAAGHIIAMLAPGGVRRIAPDAMSAIERAREASPTPTFGGFWDGVDPPSAPKRDAGFVNLREPGDEPGVRDPSAAPMPLAPVEPGDRLVRVSSTPPHRPSAMGFSIAGLPPRDQRRSPWTLLLRIAALTILLATAAALGAGKLNIRLPGAGFGAILTAPTATVPASATISEPGVATDAPGAALSPSDLTAVAVGVGSDAESAVAGTTGTSNEVAAVTQGPSHSAAPAAATKPAIPTPAPTNAPGPRPTATSDPTAAPQAATAPTKSTPPPAQEAPASAQEVMVGPVRLAIPTAQRGESLPKYGLPPGSGEWVLLKATLTNTTGSVTSVAMSDFHLLDSGTGAVANLDTGTGVIASLAGYKPARGATDVVSLNPGESADILLLYLIPIGSGDDLSLQIGQTSLDLAKSFGAGSATPTDKQEVLAPAARTSQFAFMPRGWRDRLLALNR